MNNKINRASRFVTTGLILFLVYVATGISTNPSISRVKVTWVALGSAQKSRPKSMELSGTRSPRELARRPVTGSSRWIRTRPRSFTSSRCMVLKFQCHSASNQRSFSFASLLGLLTPPVPPNSWPRAMKSSLKLARWIS